MFEDLKKTLDKGLDTAFMNAEKLAKAAREMAKENKLTKEDAKKLYDYLVAKSEEAKKSVEGEIQQVVKATLKKMDIVTKDDLKKMEARLVKLEGGKKAPAKPKKAAVRKTRPPKSKVSNAEQGA